jgi:hypothetical protein
MIVLLQCRAQAHFSEKNSDIQRNKIDHLSASLQGGETCFTRPARNLGQACILDAGVQTPEGCGDTRRSGITEGPLALPRFERRHEAASVQPAIATTNIFYLGLAR